MAICVFDVFPDGTATIPTDDGLTGGGIYRWWHYDLTEPGLADWIGRHLPGIPGEALQQPETRPRCDRFEDGLILNLRGINQNEGQLGEQMVSVRMWVAEGVVITVTLRRVFALEDMRQAMQAGLAPTSPSDFVADLVGRLTARIQEEIQGVGRLTEFFEADLEDETTPLPKELPRSRRQVIRLLRYLEPQRAALTRLSETELPIIPADDSLALRELANRTTLAVEELEALRDRLGTVQDEHDLHVARIQARHAYVLSLAAAFFLPLSFLTGLFGVNLAGMPGATMPGAFALLCLGLIVLAAAMFGLFKLRRWL